MNFINFNYYKNKLKTIFYINLITFFSFNIKKDSIKIPFFFPLLL